MSGRDSIASPTTPTASRPQASSSSSGYFARPISPAPQPRRHPADGTHPRFVRSTPGPRSESISSARRNTSRQTQDEYDIEQDRFGYSEADQEEPVDPNQEPEPEERDEDDSPSPNAEELEALQTSREFTEEDPLTLKDRQSLLNAEHPFGLPLWKPALYKKSRTVTRNAETALHSVPGTSSERHLGAGNVLWTLLFGWWLSLVCICLSFPIWVFESLAGGQRYASVVFGLGWYLFFPFGSYVEGDHDALGSEAEDGEGDADDADDEENVTPTREVAAVHLDREENLSISTIRPKTARQAHSRNQPSSDSMNGGPITERTSLAPTLHKSYRSYGTTPIRTFSISTADPTSTFAKINLIITKIVFWVSLIAVIVPLMLLASLACWALIFAIPMAKLNWELIKHLFTHPLALRFRAAPPPLVIPEESASADEPSERPSFTIKQARLSAGHPAPSGRPRSVILLCIYKALGSQYYKYTVGGVNILFVNTLPCVFLVILDGFVLLKWVENRQEKNLPVPAIALILANRGLIFVASLTSVIPLSYFIGMAVASISAQSSIGMGAVINATFGSIIEIILYSIALTESKGLLVEGSIVGSILAGVLLMPGLSMISSAMKRKESKFNAKSAGVTSTMLVMAMIGTLAPTMFYQTYGNFQLVCDGCPEPSPHHRQVTNTTTAPTGNPWVCSHCYYQHPNPAFDPFYQQTVKPFMYYCASILLLSYLIGLWFSLRTHATQIWQNPQKLLNPTDGSLPPTLGPRRMSFYQKLIPSSLTGTAQAIGQSLPTHNPPPQPHSEGQRLNRKGSMTSAASLMSVRSARGGASKPSLKRRGSQPPSSYPNMVPYAPSIYTPVLESVDRAVRTTTGGANLLELPQPISTEDFARIVTEATVSTLVHQQVSPGRGGVQRHSGAGVGQHEHDASGGGEGHGHGGPSWSRTVSASVLLSCTVLYAAIAEILVDVVDVVLEGSGIPEKVLGITLFALVPNTTEFMNAMSFAINGNISLSMEIGSAYALQVCLLQIPAMVAFSAWWDPQKMGLKFDTFTLIFPRWDVIAIILSIFLLTYTYIEAKSNYHRGSILVLSYLVLAAGFFFAPPQENDLDVLKFSAHDTTSPSFSQVAKTVFNSFWLQ